jgi:glycosyltransferase involved in cell wall biosynthesis
MFGVRKEKIIVERNAVDIKEFNISITKKEARIKLDLPIEKYIVVYTGHLYSWKGVDTLAEAAQKLSAEYLVVFVGGTEKDVKYFKEIHANDPHILIVGHKKHHEIPLWQRAADVLALPNTAKENISKYYTSPMKLFEYMASGTPIVVSHLPSLMELLNEENAVFFEPDNSDDLSKKIIWILKNKEMAEGLASRAMVDVQRHSWGERAKRILMFIVQNAHE